MRKRIKHYLQENEELIDLSQKSIDQDPNYLSLLINDLKKEAEKMPAYSMWQELVKKCLVEKTTDN